MDPGGVVSEKVCGPVREYLYHRDDTVRCIVASLTTDCDSELAEVSAKQSFWLLACLCQLLTLGAHAQEGYGTCPVCVSVCLLTLNRGHRSFLRYVRHSFRLFFIFNHGFSRKKTFGWKVMA